jgi:hypothetical protein
VFLPRPPGRYPERPGPATTGPSPGPLGRSGTVGVLRVGDPLGPAAAEALRFNPWTTGPGIRPVGRLNRLRRPSYPG